ncbi:MAG: T9SS type A sorting domain-containing protein [Bacteroidetes bacterium]|nr:T9SS type A sorting domain-containing protein [Bacteroidota bacterium]
MRIYLLLICLMVMNVNVEAQIPKTTIVEHFTNSSCGVCAYTNPFIADTLSNFPDVLRIAFYPSSPYANCFFSLQNPIENDARTNFYGVYGGTPKLLVNGELTTLANLDSKLQTAAVDTTSYKLRLTQEFVAMDSVWVRLMIKKVAPDFLVEALLFMGAAEDTVFQTTGNGESVHRDVFRKAMTNAIGDNILLPIAVNDSVVFNFSYKVDTAWDANRMNTIAILQNISDKKLINAIRSTNISPVPNSLSIHTKNTLQLYPVPASDMLFIEEWQQFSQAQIFSMQGSLISTQAVRSKYIDLSSISDGTYILKLSGARNAVNARIVVKH